MVGFLQQLFDYNFYCNKTLIEHCAAMGEFPHDGQRLFSHILNAHHIWNQRILKGEAEYGIWELHPVAAWEGLHYGNQRDSFEIIGRIDNFRDRVEYTNSQGRTFSNEVRDVLFHIINHSTHHRGQLMVELRAAGHPLPGLDYIFYKR